MGYQAMEVVHIEAEEVDLAQQAQSSGIHGSLPLFTHTLAWIQCLVCLATASPTKISSSLKTACVYWDPAQGMN